MKKGKLKRGLVVCLFVGSVSSFMLFSICSVVPQAGHALEKADQKRPSIEDVPPPNFSHPFRVGEKLSYKVKFLGFVIGKESLEVKDIVQINGHAAYLFISTVKTIGLASLFYRFNEKIESFVDVETLYPRRSIIYTDAGSTKSKEIWIEVNLEEGIAIIEDKKVNYTWKRKFSLPVLEAVSLIYWLRTQDLEVGKKLSASFIEGHKMRKLTVEVVGREKVHAPIGSFSAFLCSETASTERKIWLSDDEKRLPVKIQAETPIGLITAYLSEIESGK